MLKTDEISSTRPSGRRMSRPASSERSARAGVGAAGADGRIRAAIESVTPIVDGGRFPIKRCDGDTLVVEADVFADGHDQLRALLLHRARGARNWTEVEMTALGNDHWRAQFTVLGIGVHEYTVAAWVDHYLSWRHDLERWSAPEDIAVALAVGAE